VNTAATYHVIGGAAAAWPLAARGAQQANVPIVRFLGPRPSRRRPARSSFWFKNGPGEAGYVGSQCQAFEYRWGK